MVAQALAAQKKRTDEATDAERAPRLLVVDDEILHRMIICRAAAKVGYVPVGAASYLEAQKLLQQNVFDCITLDMTLKQKRRWRRPAPSSGGSRLRGAHHCRQRLR